MKLRPGDLYVMDWEDIHLYGDTLSRTAYLQEGEPIIILRESSQPWADAARFIHVLTPHGPGDINKTWLKALNPIPVEEPAEAEEGRVPQLSPGPAGPAPSQPSRAHGNGQK